MVHRNFDDIRPYRDDEIPAAMQRIASDPSFQLLASYVYPKEDLEYIRGKIREISSINEFQQEVMRCVNEQVISRSTTGFTYSGLEQLDKNTKYLFVSNHRDIMLDACLLQYALYKGGHETTEITFGANLMQGQLVTDIGKSNKMFKVDRPGNSPREFYQSSLRLSEYIRYTLLEKRQSIWIAQRNGRTKDGIDKTDQGIIKMFGMSGTSDKAHALAELNIVPVSVSYEWESCDMLKTLELYRSIGTKYVKKPGEDLNSILTGIVQPKGHVHISFCTPVTHDDLRPFESCSPGDFHRKVARLLDERICKSYRLMANNYIAYDLLHSCDIYRSRYTSGQQDAFLAHLDKLGEFSALGCDIKVLRNILLGIYANPVASEEHFRKNSI